MSWKVLQIAYACNPEGHGEHWLGWAWVEQARALGAEVHVVTYPRHRAEVERGAAALGVHAHFVEVPRSLDALCLRLSLPGRYWRQAVWQRRLDAYVRALQEKERFDLVHQTTYHTFRVPFRAALALDLPAVWGPIAGGENVPPGFSRYLGPARWSETPRPFLNRLWLNSRTVQRALRRTDALLVSNQTTLNYLPEFCRAKSRIVPPNALRGDLPAPALRSAPAEGSPLRLFFAGNCAGTRAMPLVLEAMQAVAAEFPTELTVAGAGAAVEFWKREAARLGVTVRFAGHVSRAELGGMYASADAFVFPALRDSGGSGLLEAMSLGIPVVCLDWGGPAEMVDAASGLKIPVTTPTAVVAGLADAFRRLRREPGLGVALGQAAIERCRREFTWERKREVLREVYAGVVAGRRG